MKKFKAIFCLLLLSVTIAISQTLTVLNKSDTFIAPENGTIVMDKYTFGKYHYTSEKYDTLKREIMELDSAFKLRDSIQSKIMFDYENLLTAKEKETATYKVGYEDVTKTLQSSIEKNTQLQDYKKLEHKNRRIKRWRNIFAGSSFCFSAVIILIVAL